MRTPFLRSFKDHHSENPDKAFDSETACLVLRDAWMHDDEPDEKPTYEDGQDIRDRTFAFACRVVKFCQAVFEAGGVGRIMAPQLVHCSTSTAAMLEEARAAESDADFVSKCSVSLKECRESWIRVRVFHVCRIGPPQEARWLVQEANELVAIITTIIKNKRRNMRTRSRGRAAPPRFPISKQRFRAPHS
jgi:four helix bundle protein